VAGGRSATLTPICSRKGVSLDRLVFCSSDGLPLWRGQSAGLSISCSRNIAASVCFSRMNCGQSAG
jgi:hypothetical protein